MSQGVNSTVWGKFFGTLILAIGVLLLLQTLEIISWEFWEFIGPALLIVWGIAILRNPDSFACCCFLPYRDRAGTKNMNS
ncbi:MAG: LiaI-LiaF-like domain-containing protein [bacterium]